MATVDTPYEVEVLGVGPAVFVPFRVIDVAGCEVIGVVNIDEAMSLAGKLITAARHAAAGVWDVEQAKETP